MEFKVGDVVFYDWIGFAEEVHIIKCFPNTNRYRIRHKSSFEMNAKESEVFRTENDLWRTKVYKIDAKIKSLEEKRDEYKGKIVENHILNE